MMDVTRRESGTRTRKRDVVFLTAKLGSSRATTKSEYHSSSNIIAIYKQSKTTICGKSHKFSQLKEEHGGFLSGVERKHKNERTATRQRATLHNGVARCVFLLTALYSLHPHPMDQSANLFPSRTPISSQRPTPRDHRSIETQKNSRENKTTAHFRAFLPR